MRKISNDFMISKYLKYGPRCHVVRHRAASREVFWLQEGKRMRCGDGNEVWKGVLFMTAMDAVDVSIAVLIDFLVFLFLSVDWVMDWSSKRDNQELVVNRWPFGKLWKSQKLCHDFIWGSIVHWFFDSSFTTFVQGLSKMHGEVLVASEFRCFFGWSSPELGTQNSEGHKAWSNEPFSDVFSPGQWSL